MDNHNQQLNNRPPKRKDNTLKIILITVGSIFLFFIVLTIIMVIAVESDISQPTTESTEKPGEREPFTPPEKPQESFWTVRYFVDEFREPTEEKYITNRSRLKGTFSNSAVTDRDLGVDFIIAKSTVNPPVSIAIQLYEYGRNHPVRGSTSREYTILVQCKDGERHTLKGRHSTDRMLISNPEQLHEILMRGGRIGFRITEEYGATYLFFIENADGYKEAVAEL